MNTSDLHKLLSRPLRPRSSVLSVYLNVDQANVTNINRGFETRLKTITHSLKDTVLDPAERETLMTAVHHISEFVSVYQPGARSLVVFFDESDGFMWHTELAVSLTEDARWNRQPFLEPLARALDELEKYAVVLVDRNNLRLFMVSLGTIEERLHKGFGSARVRHIKTAGTDRMGSSSRIQRRADEQIQSNLRQVVDRVDALVRTEKIHRLIFAGTPEITAELKDLFPERLALRIIGTVDIRMTAPPSDVLSATERIARGYEKGTELQKVTEVITAAAKHEKAVVGLGHTLKELNSNRVWELIYAENFSSAGYECTKCAALFSVHHAICAYCAGAIEPVTNVVECAVGRALRQGAKIEFVTDDEAAGSLYAVGGIGAFLKTRTAVLAN
jgi:peptide subunit release factor 1 (eRF1)